MRRPITEYQPSELVALIRWIDSDGLLRTEEETIREAMTALGFRRRGSRIETALRAAIAADPAAVSHAMDLL